MNVNTDTAAFSNSLNKIKSLDTPESLWKKINIEIQEAIVNEPRMSSFFNQVIASHDCFEDSIIFRVSRRLHNCEFSADNIFHSFQQMIKAWPDFLKFLRYDILAVYHRDPACTRLIEPILYFKGFHAIQAHRLAHWNWNKGYKDFALYLQSRSSEIFSVDIHPAAKVGYGLFLDHSHSVVVGATAKIGNDVSILHNVTLGGTGKQTGDRHPKIGNGVLLGAGAIVLGNITIGDCSRVAAGSLVLTSIPEKVTVAGVPAKIVGIADCIKPSQTMNQILFNSEKIK